MDSSARALFRPQVGNRFQEEGCDRPGVYAKYDIFVVLTGNCMKQHIDPEVNMVEVIRRLPHATATQAAVAAEWRAQAVDAVEIA